MGKGGRGIGLVEVEWLWDSDGRMVVVGVVEGYSGNR